MIIPMKYTKVVTMVTLILLLLVPHTFGNSIITDNHKEYLRTELLTDLISLNLKTNGWTNIFCMGIFPDVFYSKITHLHHTFTIADIENDYYEIEDIIPYQSNIIVITCLDLNEFEAAVLKIIGTPYWHPHSNIILYYHTPQQDELAKIFFIFWYYKACNAIIVQYDDFKESTKISYYNPFITENYRLQYSYGCWKTAKLGRPITTFEESFMCEEGCQNVTLKSKLRAQNLGTCIGFSIHEVQYGDTKALRTLNLFEDISKNLHGFVFRAYAVEVLPFLPIKENSDGTYTPYARDGTIWTITSKLMNFGLDLSPSRDVIKQPFNFQTIVQQAFTFAQRRADLLMVPFYLFDTVIIKVDLSIPYKDSGVCVLSHRADFETILFDFKLLQNNYMLVVRFLLCFLFIWLVFFIFNGIENNCFAIDQAGKDFLNTVRNVLSISLYNPPKRESFRIFLLISIWSFFIINFATQAAIVSFFSAFKRGKEVETFDDVNEKGYVVEGMASPDIVLPETEERFIKFNSKFVALNNMFTCINSMINDSRRFCLIDCSVGRYLERNKLNEKGQQYLHIASEKIHNHYLALIFQKHSPLTNTFNKYLRIYIEAGLIRKWEDYRFTNIKEEAPIKALTMEDLLGIYKCYYFLIGLSAAVFVLEVIINVLKCAKHFVSNNVATWKRTRVAMKKLKLERKLGKIKIVNSSTQTTYHV